MGYTRYYKINGKLDTNKFKEYSKLCEKVCKEITKEFENGIASWDGTGEPEFLDDSVSFNGIGDLSHESFFLSTTTNGFNFTKTARKPYDKHVCACLILAKEFFGDKIEVSSDGDNDDIEVKNFLISLNRDNKIENILG